jgi:putative photosynthetic complex assembly protein 2
MASPWVAALLAIAVWWASTGAILVAVTRADRAGGNAHLMTVCAALPLLALGWAGVLHTVGETTVWAAYVAFLSSIAIWGWFELAFLAGVLTGPNVRPCPLQVAPWERFIRAWGTIAHSEMALIATLVGIAAIAWDAANPVGFWTFAILFSARVSAKLNVYLGVPNINIEFLPAPVRHLASHFRTAPMNGFFPLAITALTLAFACWFDRLVDQGAGSGAAVGFALLAALTGLALLEHWLMVLPLPDARLWRWLVAARQDRAAPTRYLREDVHGLR